MNMAAGTAIHPHGWGTERIGFDQTRQMVNRLAASTSPYLRQHRDNPVDWYEWGEEAFATARERDVPILLSVGYSACHWCHVMAHESFEDETTAGIMNRRFVNVKVDREERPDVDAVYMEAVQAMTGRGGWPMTVWLTPDGEPFYAGTYFPSHPRGHMPTFGSVIEAITDAWENRRHEITEQAGRLTETISRRIPVGGTFPGTNVLEAAYRALEAAYDPVHGGFGSAPKFPQQPVLEFLLRIVHEPWAPRAGEMLGATLAAMARGGIYDQVGGGFARYSTDSSWLVPHFEKMLYDNAQLARIYLWAWRELGHPEFASIADETLAYLRTDLRHPDGGFFSAEDADSEGEEGRYYVWTAQELGDILEADDLEVALLAFGVTEAGNFEGSNILHVARTVTEVAALTGRTVDSVRISLEGARTALLAARGDRVRPGLDHKVVASWNGIAIRAFAEAGVSMGRPDLLDDARSCARFVLDRMTAADGRLLRSWSEGEARIVGFLEDHASVAVGLFTLYQATGEIEWFQAAQRITRLIPELFADPDGGFFTTAVDAEALVKRPKDQLDTPLPSGNSLAAEALMWLAMFTGEPGPADTARATVSAGAVLLERYPAGVGHLAAVLASMHHGLREVAVAGPDADRFVERFWARYRPHAVLAVTTDGSEPIPLLEGRAGTDRTRAFVCEGFTCNLPVTDPGEMADQIG
jgi:uncharacterized protein